MLEVLDLECTRGDRPLFSDLSFYLDRGQLLRVLGPNGAGKTTLLRTLCGLTRPTAGAIHWNARTIPALGDEYRQQLAYVGHRNGIQGDLTCNENLRVATCLNVARDTRAAMTALDRLGLAPYHHLPAKILSQGQKRRLALARLLVADKPLWILDEPFSALDVESCQLMASLLAEHLSLGGLVVLTSHQELAIEAQTLLTIRLGP